MQYGQDIRLPEKLAMPARPRFWLWLIIAMVTSALITLCALLVFPEIFREALVLLSSLFVSSILTILGFRYSLFERKSSFVTAWNEQRETTRDEFTRYKRQCLYLSSLSILTSYGRYGNAQLAWRQEAASALRHRHITEHYDMTSEPSQEENLSLLPILDYVLRPIAIEKNERHPPELFAFIPEGVAQQLSLFLSKKVTFPVQPVVVANPNQGIFYLDQWIDHYQAVKHSVLLLWSDTSDKNADHVNMAMACLFHRQQQANSLVRIHRAVCYQSDNDILLALAWGNVTPEQIEGIWFSGADDAQRAHVIEFLSQSRQGDRPQEINIDSTFDVTSTSTAWFALGLAAERTMTHKKAQLIITSGRSATLQVVAPC